MGCSPRGIRQQWGAAPFGGGLAALGCSPGGAALPPVTAGGQQSAGFARRVRVPPPARGPGAAGSGRDPTGDHRCRDSRYNIPAGECLARLTCSPPQPQHSTRRMPCQAGRFPFLSRTQRFHQASFPCQTLVLPSSPPSPGILLGVQPSPHELLPKAEGTVRILSSGTAPCP